MTKTLSWIKQPHVRQKNADKKNAKGKRNFVHYRKPRSRKSGRLKKKTMMIS